MPPVPPLPGGPVAPGAGLPLAGFGRRLAARCIDYTLLSALLFLFFIATMVFLTLANPGVDQLPDPVFEVWAYLFLFGWGLALFLYDWLSLAAWSGTPGKRMLSIKVVRTDGHRMSQGQAAGRSALFGLPHSVLCLGHLFLIVDCLWPLADSRRSQSLHDKMSGTLVVLC